MAGKPRHGHASIGSRSRLYDIWKGIRQRCSNPKATGYADYGGRGINVDSAWKLFEDFLSWAESSGYQNHLSIERRDVDQGYSPANCYWATNTIQACNKRKRIGQKSPYIGVAPMRAKWQAYGYYRGSRTHISIFENDHDAAHARNAFIKANGLPHKLNF